MVTPQQYNLRWNNHTHNLIQVLSEHYEKGELVDVTLSCEGKFLKAHKVVLGACSPYFQEIFDRHACTQHPVIILNGFKFEEIRLIAEFMYHGEVKVTESDLESLLAAAETLEIKGLSNVKTAKNVTDAKSPPHPLHLMHSTPNENVSNGIPPNIIKIKALSDKIKSEHEEVTCTGTPLHLKRKRTKTTVKKEVKENVHLELMNSQNKITNHTSSTSSDGKTNCDDLPMTIKISPPYIRDIDEGNETGLSQWERSSKESNGLSGLLDAKECRLGGKGLPSVADISMFSGASGSGLVGPKEKIPRPPNAFMIFANEYRRKLAIQFPNESNKEISVRLGVMWKNLATKEDYYTASRLANDEHKKKYPDYYYSPKEARLRKRLKMQHQQVNQLNQLVSTGQYNPLHLVKVFMNEDGGDQNNPTIRSVSH